MFVRLYVGRCAFLQRVSHFGKRETKEEKAKKKGRGRNGVKEAEWVAERVRRMEGGRDEKQELRRRE